MSHSQSSITVDAKSELQQSIASKFLAVDKGTKQPPKEQLHRYFLNQRQFQRFVEPTRCWAKNKLLHVYNLAAHQSRFVGTLDGGKS